MKDVTEIIKEVIYAVLPLAALILVMQVTLLHLPFAVVAQFLVGVVMVSLGLAMFLIGVHVGLLPIGEMIGSALPKTGKVWMVIFFTFVMGFVVTVAEPDVRVLSSQIDLVSDGEISQSLLIYTVALGLAIFVGLSVVRTILGIPITWLLTGGYALVFLLAYFTPDHFVSISFDAGGVTTGPMAVPFILAFGVGIASVLKGKATSSDGFGLVALASIGPIIAVLILGIIYG